MKADPFFREGGKDVNGYTPEDYDAMGEIVDAALKGAEDKLRERFGSEISDALLRSYMLERFARMAVTLAEHGKAQAFADSLSTILRYLGGPYQLRVVALGKS
jgi:hypothetical protein